MEQFLFGTGLLFGFLAWNAWKRTALDACRDKLFDIRDDARRYFIARGIPLTDDIYIALRGLLNAHIRYAKRMTFPGFISMTFAFQNERDVMVNMREEINSRLKTGDEELSAYIEKARKESSEAMLAYIGETSAFIIFAVIISWPFYVGARVLKTIGRVIDEQNKGMVKGMSATLDMVHHVLGVVFNAVPLAIVSVVMTLPARAGTMDHRFENSAKMLEEFSYEASLSR